MKRIALFLLTNIAVVAVLGIVASLLGVNRYLTANGLNLGALLGFAFIMGFGGAIISLLMSKPMAKMSMGVQIINEPRNQDEAWIVETVRGFADKHGVQIINYFGSNEGAALAGGDTDIPDPALRAQYFPRAGVEGYEWSISTARKIRTRLVDPESGADITVAGQPGELRFSGPTVFSGYFRAPELSAHAFDGQGFYKTGDLFEIAGDQLQYYRYVGRSKDLVIRGGMNISSEEIEGMLAACPGVREVAVVGVPDAILGEKLCACVAAIDGQAMSLEVLTRYLRDVERIASYKLPEYFLPVETLPRNPVGKILKRDLREQARALAPKLEAA
jgi:acyl-CoA synthetase (AMP-forming)/AMP-acid ligase II